jgi:hypothetical protein
MFAGSNAGRTLFRTDGRELIICKFGKLEGGMSNVTESGECTLTTSNSVSSSSPS